MNTTRASLLLRIRNRHDGEAWREFDAIYRPMLFQFALARGLRHSEAEDVVQHCMAAVHEHIGTFDYDPARGRFKSWLRTLVNNRIRNLLRDCREFEADSRQLRATPSDDAAPDELFDRMWMDEHLKYALVLVRGEVEDQTFRAFQMYVIDERPVEEVCAALGINANQVHKSKYRITRRLAERLAEFADEDG